MKQLTILLATFLLFSLELSAQCTGLSLNEFVTDNTCFSSGDGSIQSNPTGGVGPYSYQLYDGSTFVSANSTGVFTGLFAGTYDVVVFDQGNSCYDTTAVIVNEPAPLLVNETITDNTQNNNGAISITVSGGTGGYSYNWTGPNGFTSTSQNISGLTGGTYVVDVTDNNGCNTTQTYLVDDIFSTIYGTVDPWCPGSADGEIQVNVFGGSGNYIFEVLDFSMTSIYSSTSGTTYYGLPAGSYYYVINDQVTADSDTVYFELYDPIPITAVETITHTSCGQCNGSIVISFTGGSAPFTYMWANGSTTLNQYGLCTGVYDLVITDANGCSASFVYTVGNSGSAITASTSAVDANCGMCDGNITVTASGGTSPYNYQWDDPTFQTFSTASGLCAGTYSVTVTDNIGCSVTVSDVVNNNATFSASTSVTDATCSSYCDGSITLTTTGGTAPFNYQWDDPNLQTTSTATGLCAGTYSVVVTDANGCAVTLTAIVNDNVVVSGTTANLVDASCSACDGSVQIIGAGGTLPYSYFNLITSETNSTGIFDSLCATSQYIEVIDANGCSGVVPFTVNQAGLSGLNYSSTITDESAPGANDGSIDISYDINAYPNLTFLWLPDSITNEDLYNLPAGTYSINITDSTSGGCASYVETVNVLPSNGYISGQIFQDNNNDCVFNTGDGYMSNVTVTITDGTNTYTALTNWNGYYSVLVPNGTYTVTPNMPTPFTSSCNPGLNVTVSGSNVTGVNFAATAPPYEDLCVNTYGWGFVPGFTATISAYVYNYGNVLSDGDLSVVIPSGTSYLSSTVTPTSINGDTLYFSLTNIVPGSPSWVYVNVYVPTWFQIGDPIEFCTSVELLGGGTDINPGCNDNCYYSVVVGSYDPNDKAVQPQGIDNQGFIETDVDEFTYTIRFQNTGTAPAHNVYITDTLDSMLDRNTLQVLAVSHDMNIEFINNDVVKFRFDNIMLPDSNANEPESHGYVQFRINTMNTPQLTETVQNTANIYFDFNEPVITNTTLNTYADFSTVESTINANLRVYPNPASTLLYTSVEEIAAYRILDINGKLVQAGTIQANESIDVQQLTSGLYFIELETSEGTQRDKFTKQ